MTSIEIALDEIHLWETSLSAGDEMEAAAAQLLSPDERSYTDQFTDEHARREYVISRGKLRELLSRYAGQRPNDLRFGIEGKGKPVLVGRDGKPRAVEFNLSHSGNLVVYAVAPSREVGIDLEYLRPMPRAVELARRFMSSEEHERVAAARGDQRDREFLSMWVKRESWAKAQGTSVWRALRSRRDAADPIAQAGAGANPGDGSASGYTVRLVDYSDKFALAIAAAGSDWKIVRCGPI